MFALRDHIWFLPFLMMSSKLIGVEQWVDTFSDFVVLDDEALISFSIFDAPIYW